MHIHPHPGRRAVVATVLCAALAGATPAPAQTGPRLVRLIVPTSPGSSADVGARAVAERLQKILGRTVVVENRVGAGGSLAAAALAAAEPNGETIGMLGNSYQLFPVEFPQQKFDPAQDVAPVAMISKGTNVLLVASGAPYAGLADIVRRAHAEPGRIAYASAGVGSSTYHSTERLRTAAAVEWLHVPFKGSPEAVQEVIAGRVDFAFAPTSAAAPFLQGGRVRALAVSSSKRSALLPQTPTTQEAGVPDSSYDSWLVALVPARTPQALQAELNQAFNAAIASPEVRQRFAALGVEPDPLSLDELKAFVRQEHAKALAGVREPRAR